MKSQQGDMVWVSVGSGCLMLRGRLGVRAVAELPAAGCQRVITLLSEKEGAWEVGRAVLRAGLRWTWLPLPNGRYPKRAQHIMLMRAMPILSAHLDAGESMLIHCAADIHRTGMLAYGLLHYRRYSSDEALDSIEQMQVHMRNGFTSSADPLGRPCCRQMKEAVLANVWRARSGTRVRNQALHRMHIRAPFACAG
jgi:hypothetical protein